MNKNKNSNKQNNNSNNNNNINNNSWSLVFNTQSTSSSSSSTSKKKKKKQTMMRFLERLPHELLVAVLMSLDWRDLGRAGQINKFFHFAAKRALHLHILHHGPEAVKASQKRFITDCRYLRSKELDKVHVAASISQEASAKKVQDVFISLALTITGIFFVSLCKHQYILAEKQLLVLESKAWMFHFCLFLLRLFGPALVLFAVILIVFVDVVPGSTQKRNRIRLLIAGLCLTMADEILFLMWYGRPLGLSPFPSSSLMNFAPSWGAGPSIHAYYLAISSKIGN